MFEYKVNNKGILLHLNFGANCYQSQYMGLNRPYATRKPLGKKNITRTTKKDRNYKIT